MPSESDASSSTSSSSSDALKPVHKVNKTKKRDVSGDIAVQLDVEDDGHEDDHEDTEADGQAEGVEVLSHAEKRRQKKKQKRGEHSDDVEVSESKDEQGAKSKKHSSKAGDKDKDKPKRQNSVWVGNLSFKTTPESLKSFFEDVGEVTRVHMPMKIVAGAKMPGAARKENRGFAYVDFASAESKVSAIGYSEKNLDGRRLLIKDGGDFTGRPEPPAAADTDKSGVSAAVGRSKTAQKILSVQKQPPGVTLFLGNLGFETTVESIMEMITAHHRNKKEKAKGKAEKEEEDEVDEKVGEKRKRNDKDDGEGDEEKKKGTNASDVGIRKVRMGTFEDSGLCKGFAFVDFVSAEHATAVLINPRNHHLDGRKLVVEYASPDAVRRGGHREKGAGKPRTKPDGEDGVRKPSGRGEGRGPSAEIKQDRKHEDIENVADGTAVDSEEQGGKPAWKKRNVDNPKARHRPKPGAALALAKREKVAIVPSEGTRLTFT